MKLVTTLLSALIFVSPAFAQTVIPLSEPHGLYNAYVIPMTDRNRVDVQLVVLSGTNDEDEIANIAHYTEHLAALSSDTAVLQEPRQRDLNAFTSSVSTVYGNSGTIDEIDKLMKLTRAVLDPPKLTPSFTSSEIDIVKREVLYKERNAPVRWLRRLAIQNLYGSKTGRADDAVTDLDRISVQAAMEFHAKHYQPSNAMIIISGNIDPETAQAKLTEYFGDTIKTQQVPDLWLDHHPEPDLRSVVKIETTRVLENTIAYAKFFEFSEPQDILAMQASFFIASDIYNSHINEALYLNGFTAQNFSQGSYIAIDGDLEYTVHLTPFEGVSLETALASLEQAIAEMRSKVITPEEIEIARAKNVAYTKSLSQSPRAYLDFFQNLGSDGLPPTSPTQFAQMVADASDAEVLRIIAAFASDSPSSAILATAKDLGQ
jgi:zinc protease